MLGASSEGVFFMFSWVKQELEKYFQRPHKKVAQILGEKTQKKLLWSQFAKCDKKWIVLFKKKMENTVELGNKELFGRPKIVP